MNLMIKPAQPKPFFLKGGNKSVLLLHSFTSTTRDVKQLGEYLNVNGFSCYAPIYEGHGLSPESLIHTSPDDWWRSVEEGYHFLIKEGYAQIAVIGVSLGGLFALNVGKVFNVNGIVTMSVPHKREIDSLKRRLINYSRAYKQLEGKELTEIQKELNALVKFSIPCLSKFKSYIDMTMYDLDIINKPICIMHGELDEFLYKESASYIHKKVCTDHKSIYSYPNSEHLMTLGKDHELIFKDILSFLNSLRW